MPVDPQLASAAADLLVMKLRVRDEVSDEEAAVLRDSISEIRDYGPGRTVVRSGATLTESNLLFDGLVCRFKDMMDGERQIMELHLAGDFVDLHSFVLKRIEHNIGSLTAARFAVVPHEALRRITEGWPHLARLLWFSTLLDSAIHREKIITVARRPASARIAHLFCELYLRLQTVGLADDLRYSLPLTQADLADASGLTSVHVNRMLKELRDAGLVTFRGSEVVIHDWEGLQQAAEFSPSYLYLEQRER